jgi:Rieske Fe-S protein
MTAGSTGIGGPGKSRPTRRGVLVGASLAGLGGALAGCSIAAVPYGANEAGVVEKDTPPASGGSRSGAMTGSGGGRPASAPASPPAGPPAGGGTGAKGGKPKKGSANPEVNGTVLGTASEIPVGGGKIFTAARVVVTQPVRGQYNGFSAVCTHVGCILSEVADGTIDCPCHGSEFKITNGAVVTGPAPRPLPKKQIEVVDGQVFLV